ncbi:MAG: methyltransferase domain-containing protein [Anaerolineae bacterium]|nr:methyltransferase domain-containing protein [Anaerolineae bacterium]
MTARERANQHSQDDFICCQSEDPARVLALVQPRPDALILHLAVGDSPALPALALPGRHLCVNDSSFGRLQIARARYPGRIEPDVSYICSGADRLPFAASRFDLVTCFVAAHRLPQVDYFLDEAARVLKPGGSLLITDYVAPEDDRAARYVNAFYRLHDPRHVRAFAEYEWQGMFLNAGLEVIRSEICQRRVRLLSWAERQACPPEVIEHLQILLVQTPQAVSAFLRPICAGTRDAEFDRHCILMLGSKS